jgi:HK97 family phage portal protein
MRKWFGSVIRALRGPAAGLQPARVGSISGNYSRIGTGGSSDLTFSAAWAAVNVLTQDIAKLPFYVWRELPDGGRQLAKQSSLYSILRRPNAWQTQWDLLLYQMLSLLTDGNSYNLIIRNRELDPVELIPIQPFYVTIWQVPTTGELFYNVAKQAIGRETDERLYVPARDILHIRGLSTDTVYGYPPLEAARRAVEFGQALESQGSGLYAQGGKPGGVLTVPYTLNDEQARRIKGDWESLYAGDGQGRTALLEDGMKFEPLTFRAVDAQFLENRKFQVEEIARIFRVPAFMIGSTEKLAYNSIEHLTRLYVDSTLVPYGRNFELAYDRAFLTTGFYTEFDFDELTRADTKTRYEKYASARQWGILNANECRAMEGLNPYPGGERYFQPLNMIDAQTPIEPEQE